MDNQNLKKRLAKRLRIISGQVRGIEKMIMDNKYCMDILHQSMAVKEAISGFQDLILENHLSTHVVEQIRSGDKARSVKEILSIYKLSRGK